MITEDIMRQLGKEEAKSTIMAAKLLKAFLEGIQEGVAEVVEEDDPRFRFNVGQTVRVTRTAGGSKEGVLAIITGRRNGYPPPIFDCWFPIYFLKHIDGSKGGGEIHENCLKATVREEQCKD